MTKRFISRAISILIALTMLLALLPAGFIIAHAESGWCGDNLTWMLDGAGNLTISGSGDMWEYDYWDDPAPWGKNIASVNIQRGVTSIGDWAFEDCISLTNVTIGNGVTSIGCGAFLGCTGLTSVTIPESVTSIGDSAFKGCTGLASVTIPDSVTSIGDEAFFGCTGLTSITVSTGNLVYHSAGNCLIETESKTLIAGCKNSVIPSDGSVRSIGDGAFGGCTGLTSVTIGNGVTSIGYSAFSGCTGLKSITIPDSVEYIESCAFCRCTGLTSITIPNSVTSIGDDAFSGCTGLTSVTIGNSVAEIGHDAFVGCSGLASIVVISGNPVYYGSGHCLIERASKTLILGCKNSVIPSDGSVTSIGESAFSECTGLTSITIPNSVTSIGSNAFYGCTGLTSVTIGSGVTSIGWDAFWECTGLTSITIPDSVTSIGGEAFYGCNGLKNIKIGSGVTSIGWDAFCNTGYSNDESNWENDVLYLGKWLIEASYRLSGSYSIKRGTVGIAGCAFAWDENLTSVTIPDSVMYIGGEAFGECVGLTSVTIGNGVTQIRDYAFEYCTGLTSITIPDSVTSIGDLAFYNCTGLTSVTIGSGVTSIGYGAFHYYDWDTDENKPLDVTLRVYNNSYAHQYAIDNGLYYEVIDNITRIAVTTLPAKTTYFKYKEALDVTGGRITLYYDNGTSEVIDMTADMVSGFDNTKAGSQTLTVTYGDRTASFNVNVVEKTLERIAVTALPDKTIYQKGEALDVTGGKITLYYSDGSSATINMSASMVSGFDNTKSGEQTLRVTFGGKATVFTVTVVKPAAAMGDPDGDGEITVADALAALRIAAKLAEPTPELLAACDTDGDGEITVADALKILRVAAKLVDSL